MSDQRIEHVYTLKGGSEEALNRVNPVLERREPVVVFSGDSIKLKVGDGTRSYNELPFVDTLPSEAEGTSAFVYGENARAITDYSVALGKETVAGCRGYFVKSYDLENKKIYLSDVQVVPVISSEDNTDRTFETPAYTVGERFSVINKHHYFLCSSIVSVDNNVITYKEELPFNTIKEDYDIDAGAFFVTSQPTVGVVTFYRSSFAVGERAVAIGHGASALGTNSKAIGSHAHAVGEETIAASWSHAEGHRSAATGLYAHAEGKETDASGQYSHAEGWLSHATGERSHAEGSNTWATGVLSHAEGNQTTASGKYAHSEGAVTTASGNQSHAEGYSTTAASECSHAEGFGTSSENPYSHAEGFNTKAKHSSAHSEGNQTTASGYASHSEGIRSIASGDYSHAEGEGTIAKNRSSHSSGMSTETGCDAQTVVGRYNTVVNDALFVVGNGTDNLSRSNAFEVKHNGSVFANNKQLASQEYVDDRVSKIELVEVVSALPETGKSGISYYLPRKNGSTDDAYEEWTWINNAWEYIGTRSLDVDLSAYIKNTDIANADTAGVVKMAKYGNYGLYLTTDNTLAVLQATEGDIANKTTIFKPITPNKIDYAVKQGLAYSKLADTGYYWTDEEKTNACNLIGAVSQSAFDKGTATNEAKPYTLVKRSANGVIYIGDPTEKKHAATKGYVDNALPAEVGTGISSLQQKLDSATSWQPDSSQSELIASTAPKDDDGKIIVGALGSFSAVMGGKSQATGKRAFAEGTSTVALGNYSHAEGNKTFAQGGNSHAEGLLTNAIGGNSHAEGASTRAAGDNSHAEGHLSVASGYGSHAEGNGNTASGAAAHSEGASNTSSGDCSHSEGAGNEATGYASHAEGDSNKATAPSAHVSGVLSEANHMASFAHGDHVKTGRTAQAVFGEYNKVDSDALFVVGNGNSDTDRKNAFQVNKDGTVYVNGNELSSAGEIFFAEYGKTTQSEVRSAIDSRKLAVCYYNRSWYIATFAPSGAPFINFTAVSTYDAGGNPNNSLPTIECLNLSGTTWRSGSATLVTTDRVSGLVESEVLEQVNKVNDLTFISYIDYSKVSYYDDIQAGIYAGKTIVLTKDVDSGYKDYYHLAQYTNGVDNNPPPEYLFTCIKTNADKQVVLKRILVAMGEIGGTELDDVILDLSNYATTDYVDGLVGDIETALDSIIAIQNNLIGGNVE